MLEGQPSGDVQESSQPPPPESAPATGRCRLPTLTLRSGMFPEDAPAAPVDLLFGLEQRQRVPVRIFEPG
jgi:hypothetical protein